MDVRPRLEGRYRWWRGSGAEFKHRPDLAIAFLERALELAARGGVVGLLVPAKLATAGYGAAAPACPCLRDDPHPRRRPDGPSGRRVRCHGLSAGADSEEVAAADRPESAPVALELRSGLRGPDRAPGRRPLDPVSRPHPHGRGPAGARAPRLGERVTCHLGVKTGANHLFLDPPETIEPELLRWAVRGRDVRPFHSRPARAAAVDPRARRGAAGAPSTRRRGPPHATRGRAPRAGGLRAAGRPGRCSEPMRPPPPTGWCGPTSRVGSPPAISPGTRTRGGFRSTPATSPPPGRPRKPSGSTAWLNSSWIGAARANRRNASRRRLPQIRGARGGRPSAPLGGDRRRRAVNGRPVPDAAGNPSRRRSMTSRPDTLASPTPTGATLGRILAAGAADRR